MIKNKYILILLLTFICTIQIHAMDFAPNLSKKTLPYDSLIAKANQADENADSILYYSRLALPLASNEIEQAEVFKSIGKGYIIQDSPDSGFYYLNEARKIFVEKKDNNGLARTYDNFGKAFAIYHNYEKAKFYYLKALHLTSEKLKVSPFILYLYNCLADADDILGNYSSAHVYLDYIDSAYSYKFKKDYRYYKSKITRSQIYTDEGKFEKALNVLNKMLDSIDKIKNAENRLELYLEIYHQQGILYYYMSDVNQSIAVYEKGMDISKSANDSLEFGKNLLAFYILNDENQKATHLANTLIHHPKDKAQHQAELFVILLNYTEALNNLDSTQKAKEVYYQAKNIIDKAKYYYFINDLNSVMKSINKDESLEMYKEINDYIPLLIERTQSYDTENKSNGERLLQTIHIADTEIAMRDARIRSRNQLIIVISIAFLLLLGAVLIIAQKHRKVKALNKSLQDSYNLLTGEINMELRVIVQKIFDLDRDLNKLLPVKIEFESHFEGLINKIKNLLKLLDKK